MTLMMTTVTKSDVIVKNVTAHTTNGAKRRSDTEKDIVKESVTPSVNTNARNQSKPLLNGNTRKITMANGNHITENQNQRTAKNAKTPVKNAAAETVINTKS